MNEILLTTNVFSVIVLLFCSGVSFQKENYGSAVWKILLGLLCLGVLIIYFSPLVFSPDSIDHLLEYLNF